MSCTQLGHLVSKLGPLTCHIQLKVFQPNSADVLTCQLWSLSQKLRSVSFGQILLPRLPCSIRIQVAFTKLQNRQSNCNSGADTCCQGLAVACQLQDFSCGIRHEVNLRHCSSTCSCQWQLCSLRQWSPNRSPAPTAARAHSRPAFFLYRQVVSTCKCSSLKHITFRRTVLSMQVGFTPTSTATMYKQCGCPYQSGSKWEDSRAWLH